MTDEQISYMLAELDSCARDVDQYEYGLPIYGGHESKSKLVAIVRGAMGAKTDQPTPDEPIFHLLGRDPMAGALVRAWALWRRAQKEDPTKVTEAVKCAENQEAWCLAHGKTPLPLRSLMSLLIRTFGNAHMVACKEADEELTGEEREFLRMVYGVSEGHAQAAPPKGESEKS